MKAYITNREHIDAIIEYFCHDDSSINPDDIDRIFEGEYSHGGCETCEIWSHGIIIEFKDKYRHPVYLSGTLTEVLNWVSLGKPQLSYVIEEGNDTHHILGLVKRALGERIPSLKETICVEVDLWNNCSEFEMVLYYGDGMDYMILHPDSSTLAREVGEDNTTIVNKTCGEIITSLYGSEIYERVMTP